jgi:transcriptional regulator with XRE-family HTH domain
MTEEEVFGERLRRRRMALGWSQVEFASRVGLGPAAISRYEGGTYKSMTFARLRQFAEALSTTTDYLVGLTNDPGPVPERPCPGEAYSLTGVALPPVAYLTEETDRGQYSSPWGAVEGSLPPA